MLSIFGARTLAARIERTIERIEKRAHTGTLTEILETLDKTKPDLVDCFEAHLDSVSAAQVLTLKIQNLILLKYQFKARNSALIARPFGLVFDPSNSCNLACPGCVHSRNAKSAGAFDWKPGLMPGERARAFLGRFAPYAFEAFLFNYGEPLLNPETPSFIRFARSFRASTMISTNLSMAHFDAEALVESGLDYIILSIDGATQEVYERFRQKGRLELVLHNVERLVEARRAMGSRTPTLCWQFLPFEHNRHEIPKALEIARGLGVDEFRIGSTFDVSWDDPGVQLSPEIKPRVVKFRSSRGAAQSFPPPDNWAADAIERECGVPWAERLTNQYSEASSTADHTCHWLYKNIVMDAQGRIIPCCAAPTDETKLVFAKFAPADATDAFNSETYREARRFFASGGSRAYDGAPAGIHCTQCEWNQTDTNIDCAEVRAYLWSLGPEVITRKSSAMLCDW